MYSPYKASYRIGKIGKPLPAPYSLFARPNVKVSFRRGGVSMLAGVGGSFKTALALNMVTSWADQDIYTHYFSVDSDEATIAQRLSGIITGFNMDEVERKMRDNPAFFNQPMYERLGDKVTFDYLNMGWESMVFHLKSYEQKYGGYPDLVVIDNLINMASDVYAFDDMQRILNDAGTLAQKIGSHVMVLHHARLVKPDNGMDFEPGAAPPDNEIQGRMTQFPTLVMTLGAAGLTVKLAVVKNRFGWQFPDARVSHTFQVQSNMRVIER